MQVQIDGVVTRQVTLITDEIQAKTKGDPTALTLAICNLLGAANVLAEKNGLSMDCLMQTYEGHWSPVVDALVAA